jgi:hypothetical protein
MVWDRDTKGHLNQKNDSVGRTLPPSKGELKTISMYIGTGKYGSVRISIVEARIPGPKETDNPRFWCTTLNKLVFKRPALHLSCVSTGCLCSILYVKPCIYLSFPKNRLGRLGQTISDQRRLSPRVHVPQVNRLLHLARREYGSSRHSNPQLPLSLPHSIVVDIGSE